MSFGGSCVLARLFGHLDHASSTCGYLWLQVRVRLARAQRQTLFWTAEKKICIKLETTCLLFWYGPPGNVIKFVFSAALPTCLVLAACPMNSTISSRGPQMVCTRAWPLAVTDIQVQRSWITWWDIKKTQISKWSWFLERYIFCLHWNEELQL